jgi:hypothetical protein
MRIALTTLLALLALIVTVGIWTAHPERRNDPDPGVPPDVRLLDLQERRIGVTELEDLDRIDREIVTVQAQLTATSQAVGTRAVPFPHAPVVPPPTHHRTPPAD